MMNNKLLVEFFVLVELNQLLYINYFILINDHIYNIIYNFFVHKNVVNSL
jgi:hypothetical protein